MVILITGASHTGKTIFAQRLLEEYKYPYMSIDHLKMGLIRSGNTQLTPMSNDEELTAYLWPIVREMVKTAIENNQNLIVEGCYIPFTWRDDFDNEYLQAIRYICLCFSERYITEHYSEIMKYEDCIESRIDDGYCTMGLLKKENARFRDSCAGNGLSYVLIDDNYEQTIEKITF